MSTATGPTGAPRDQRSDDDTPIRTDDSSIRTDDTSDRPDDTDRPDRPDRPDDTDRPDRPDDTDRTDRTDDGDDASPDELSRDRKSVVAREKEEFGGIKIGSAFFGWLTATGTAVLLTALVAGAGTAVGVATNTDPGQAADQATQDPQTVGIAGGIALLVVLFVAYYCGGYVAGRMARFNGMKQGIAVWLWALVVAILVAVLGLVAGEKFNILGRLDSFPRIPVNEGDLTNGGIIALIAVAAVTLVGAIVGGLAGMRFHRKVDKAGLGT